VGECAPKEQTVGQSPPAAVLIIPQAIFQNGCASCGKAGSRFEDRVCKGTELSPYAAVCGAIRRLYSGLNGSIFKENVRQLGVAEKGQGPEQTRYDPAEENNREGLSVGDVNAFNTSASCQEQNRSGYQGDPRRRNVCEQVLFSVQASDNCADEH
jgi:hypothetical protein